jgi:hypothetical protein
MRRIRSDRDHQHLVRVGAPARGSSFRRRRAVAAPTTCGRRPASRLPAGGRADAYQEWNFAPSGNGLPTTSLATAKADRAEVGAPLHTRRGQSHLVDLGATIALMPQSNGQLGAVRIPRGNGRDQVYCRWRIPTATSRLSTDPVCSPRGFLSTANETPVRIDRLLAHPNFATTMKAKRARSSPIRLRSRAI